MLIPYEYENVMIPRVLEPEVMDTAKEARDYDAMDHAAVNRVFVADFLRQWTGDGTVLDLGVGTAQIPIVLCRAHPTCTVVGVDLAQHMLDVGEANVRRAELTDRIRLQRIDAKQLPFPSDHFDAVISNSIVHHIPQPIDVLREMTRVTKRDGVVFVRDLLRPDDVATLQQLVQTYAGEENAHQRKMFADSLHAALTLEEIRELTQAVGGRSSRIEQTTDRHWTWVMRK